MKYLFLDTNIYLHYNSFETIPWKKIVNDDFTIVVVPIVQAELDKIKDTGKDKLQKRAKTISSKLYGILMENKSYNVKITRCKEPVLTQEDKEQLDLTRNDNRIILSAIKSGYNVQDIVIISADKNIQFTAEDFGIPHLLMPDTYRRKAEKTEEEKRISELEAKIKEISTRVSRPVILFENGKEILSFKKYHKIDESSVVEERLNLVKKEFPEYVKKEPVTKDDYLSQLTAQLMTLDESRFAHYNEDRLLYFVEEKKVLELEVKRDELEKRFKKISFKYANVGTSPTGYAMVYLDFPDTIKLYSWKSSRTRYEYQLPIKPAARIAGLAFDRESMRKMLSVPRSFGGNDNAVWMWDVEKPIKLPYQFQSSEDPLIQNLEYKLDFEFFVDTLLAGSFKIGWTVVDSELPQPVKGVLSVFIVE